MKKFLPIVLVVAMLGCASATYKAHPGSVNLFDSQTYDTLFVTHSVIESAKASLTAGSFTPAVAAAVKAAVDDLVTAYNVADTAYLVYHSAAVAGTVTPAQIAAVNSGIVQVTNATSALNSLTGAK